MELHDHHHHHHDAVTTAMDHNHHEAGSSMTDAAGAFCQGDGMIMYMDGFRWSLLFASSSSPKNDCINILFPSWTLNTRTKFIVALLLVILFGILVEGMTKLRQWIILQCTTTTRNRGGSLYRSRSYKRWLRYCIPVLHGIQALSGYILMLIAMTYSIELLLAVVLGVTIGYYIFFVRPTLLPRSSNHLRDDHERGNDEHDPLINSAADNPDTITATNDSTAAQLLHHHVSSNPCCDFLQDDHLPPMESTLSSSSTRVRHGSGSSAATAPISNRSSTRRVV